MTIYDYAKLNIEEKEGLLKDQALFLEAYTEQKDLILVFFLQTFFVEVTIRNGKVIYNLPYQRGYMLSKASLFKKEEAIAA